MLRRYVDRTRIANYADALDARIKPDDAKAWRDGIAEQWANAAALSSVSPSMATQIS